MGASAGGLLMFIAILAALPKGAGPADPFQAFGSWFTVAVVLDVINTIVVLFFLYRIWFRKERA